MNKQKPNSQPVTMLAAFIGKIDGMQESTVEMLASMQDTVTRPHVLDDETLDRVINSIVFS